jgi:hypothetical protein
MKCNEKGNVLVIGLTGRIVMITIPKVVCGFSALVLCVGMSYAHAAHPSAETHMSDGRGSQGNQDLIRGDSTPKKGDQDGEKIDEAKLKADTKKAREEFEKRNANAKDSQNIGDKRKDSH